MCASRRPTRDRARLTKKFDADFAKLGDLMRKATEARTLADIAMTTAGPTRSNYRWVATAFGEDLERGFAQDPPTCGSDGNSHGSIVVWYGGLYGE